jgi:hypothetical protein
MDIIKIGDPLGGITNYRSIRLLKRIGQNPYFTPVIPFGRLRRVINIERPYGWVPHNNCQLVIFYYTLVIFQFKTGTLLTPAKHGDKRYYRKDGKTGSQKLIHNILLAIKYSFFSKNLPKKPEPLRQVPSPSPSRTG